MSQLDRNQAQNRSCARTEAHLMGPPSQHAYLMAPARDSLEPSRQHSRSSSTGSLASSNSGFSSGSGSDSTRVGLHGGGLRRLSDEWTRHATPAGSKAAEPKLSQAKRSGSDVHLATSETYQIALDQASQLGPVLVKDLDHHQQVTVKLQPALDMGAQKRSAKRRPHNQSRHRAQQQAQQQPPSTNLLTPGTGVDPIVLARQRRPSASNQGSLSVDQQALFSAVECRQLERAKAILEEGKVNVNSPNGDKLTCLDIAVLLGDVEMVRLLQLHQAKESSAYLSREGRASQLHALYIEAKHLVEDLARSLNAISPPAAALNNQQQQHPPVTCPIEQAPTLGGPLTVAANQTGGQLMLATGCLLSSALIEEKQRQLQYWRRRLDLFMQMRYQFEQLQVPNAPELVVLQVLGETSLGVKIVHSAGPLRMVQPNLGRPVHLDQEKVNQLSSQCPNGVRCSHWLLCEHATPGAPLQPARPSSQTVSFSSSKGQLHEERLAIFNQLLAQQLLVLSGHQRTGPAAAIQGGTPPPTYTAGTEQSFDSSIRQADQSTCSSLAYELMTGLHQGAGLGLAREVDRPGSDATSSRQELALGGISGQDARRGSRGSLACANQIITKYKVEWSSSELMEPASNSMIVYSTNSYPLECQINGLSNGQLYYVRVSAGNHRGFSEARATTPLCLSPSSWRQVDGNKRRKYDEQVFRKFTKLILLNKHILDDRLPSNPAPVGTTLASGLAHGQQNKSSLINMLLLDATMPVAPSAVESAAISADPHDRDSSVGQQQQPASSSVRKNLKSFFQQSSSKFHKLNNQNKRGLYLTTVIYNLASPQKQAQEQQQSNKQTSPSNSSRSVVSSSTHNKLKLGESLCGSPNDKVVVTNDDRLPIIEVVNDLVSPGALMSDFYWLLKINGTRWMDIKRLRQQLQKSHSSSTLHLRIKLLNAVEQMQMALNMEDIGRLFYKPIQAHDGSIVICTCKQVSSTKMVSNLSTKWTHQHKIIPRHLRKIAESMQQNRREREQREHLKQQLSRQRAESTADLANTIVLPSITLNPSASSALDQRTFNCTGNGPEFRLCDSCQFMLAQRRSTMTSGSSNSSLASSNDSQAGVNVSSGSRCTCSRSNSSAITGGTLGLASSSATGSQRASSSSARSASMISQQHRHQQSLIGGSMQSGGSMAQAGYNGRLSQPQPHSSSGVLNPAQSGSNYLMLASLNLYDLLLFNLNEIIHFERVSTEPIARGLYLGFVQLQTTVESMRLLVPRARPNMVPSARVRDNAHVSREEWQLLKRFVSAGSGRGPEPAAEGSKEDMINRQQMAGRVPAARVSDPSIWCESEQKSADKGACIDSSSLNPNHLTTSGFERGRAKSVSPGLMQQAAAQTSDNLWVSQTSRAGVSISSEQLGARRSDSPGSSSSLELSSGHSQRAWSGQHKLQLRLTKDTNSNRSPTSAGRNTLATSLVSLAQPAPEETFVRLVGNAARRLLAELRSQLPKVWDERSGRMVSVLQSLNDQENSRIYHVELIELSSQVTFILLIPSSENVCPVTSHDRSDILADNRDYMLLPLQIFETTHISTYEPDLLGKYSRLSAILETDLIVAQHDHRQAFSSTELKSTKSRVSHLQDMVSIADEFWRQLRWIVDVVSFARDKSSSASTNCIRLASIWRHFDLAPANLSQAHLEAPQLALYSGDLEPPSTANGHHDHVKRTTSARNRNRAVSARSACTLRDSVPELCGRNQPIRKVESSQLTCSSLGARRHSGDAAASTRRALDLAASNQADKSGSFESVEVTFEDGTSLLEFKLQQTSEEEEAIYAYHISLKDATRAAAQRKTSQQLTRNLFDQEDLAWPLQMQVGSQTTPLNEQLPTSLEADGSQEALSQERWSPKVVDRVETSPEHSNGQAIGQCSGQLDKACQPEKQKRKLKSTNPFLSDSFEMI